MITSHTLAHARHTAATMNHPPIRTSELCATKMRELGTREAMMGARPPARSPHPSGGQRRGHPSKGNSVNANSPLSLTTPVMRPQPSTPDMRLLGTLPHRDFLELGAEDTAPRTARRLIARTLPEWSLPHFETATSLVASELVTNAVVTTRGVQWAWAVPPVLLWLLGGPSVVALLTWDATVTAPVPRDAGDDDESGRGLAIVAGLSADCGFYYPANCVGKVTWAVIDTP